MNLRLRLFAALLSRTPSVLTLTPSQLDAVRRPLPPPVAAALFGTVARGVRTGDRVLMTDAGPVRTRLYLPARLAAEPGVRRPLVLYCHGGGWVLGNLRQSDWVCSRVAVDTGALVVSVDYRLAPEHPAPAAFEDYWAVLRHLLTGRPPGLPVDPARVAVMGDSAGGNLAALAALAHRDALASGDDDLPAAPLRHQVLVYPGTDLTLASRSIAERPDAPVLQRRDIDAFVALYLGGSKLSADDPRVSPLLAADVRDVAPALIVTSDLDALQDDGIRYAERLTSSGVPARHISCPDVPHGFLSLPGLSGVPRQVLREVVRELRQAFQDDDTTTEVNPLTAAATAPRRT